MNLNRPLHLSKCDIKHAWVCDARADTGVCFCPPCPPLMMPNPYQFPRHLYNNKCKFYGFEKIPVPPIVTPVRFEGGASYKVEMRAKAPPVRDLGTAPRYAGIRMARALANQLARYAASIENQTPRFPGDDLTSRATLAREMSVIYFRAAELEEKS